jgi:hypothetical protein
MSAGRLSEEPITHTQQRMLCGRKLGGTDGCRRSLLAVVGELKVIVQRGIVDTCGSPLVYIQIGLMQDSLS